jgi:Na+/H+-dicarboxylate symporter/ABC-type amino acid transport substrate-binding protein
MIAWRGNLSTKTRLRLSLSSQVVLGLVSGIVVGISIGEIAAFLQTIGKVFILLLQMTVLPYITLSLITGLGHLSYQEVKMLVFKVGGLLAGSWLVAFAAILLIPLTFPVWQSASFFSTALVEPPKSVNFFTLFIPSNPFYAFANNLVPAVVLFSIAVGIALIGMEQKHGLLADLTILNRAMTRVTQFIARLTPFGVFAVAASAAGTMNIEEFERLQLYLLIYAALALLLTFWVLPALITSLLPLTYREVVGQTKDVLVTAFATGSALIVLPLLVERSKELLRQRHLSTDDTEAMTEVIIPALTSFPKIGTLLPMSFVLFAGWFAGAPVSPAQYPTFAGAGLVSFFGSVHVAIPMLLDLLHIPIDLYQLYLAIGVVTDRFSALLTTMNNLMLTLLGACAVGGLLSVSWRKVLRHALLTVVLLVVIVGGTRAFFNAALSGVYHQDELIARMQPLRSTNHAMVHLSPPSRRVLRHPQPSGLELIRTQGILRVGYLPDSLPFTYFNAEGQLVGFNVEMAHTLTRDLGVALEFVPISREAMAEQLDTGYCDIVMAPVAVTPERAQTMIFSTPYVDQTLAFIVKDHRRNEFNSRAAIRRLQTPRIGVLNIPYYIDKVRRYLPQATLVVLNSAREFFESRGEELDAFLFSAESGSAWSLLYPAYTVAIPQPDVLAVPLAYAMARGDQEWVNFINTWIELKKKDRTIATLYDHWILGKHAVPKQPRWSLLRNVLGIGKDQGSDLLDDSLDPWL